jgi:hypothetical protein
MSTWYGVLLLLLLLLSSIRDKQLFRTPDAVRGVGMVSL